MGAPTRQGVTAGPRGRLRRRVRALRSGIVFTRVFEDHAVDRAGLGIEPGDRVLVIASAGDKALDAIAHGAGAVDAVDSNEAQLHLLALKLAAVRALDHDRLIELFSDGRSETAGTAYATRLRPLLDEPARRYWDRWIWVFGIGLHRHHPIGVAMAAVGVGLRGLGGPRLQRAIMGVPDAAAQGRVYERVFRRRYWNPVTRWLLGRTFLLRSVVLDPQERAALGREGFAAWLEAGVSRIAAASLIRENPYWMPLLGGRPVEPRHEVPWLRPEALAAVSAGAGRVRLVHGSVVDVLAASPGSAYDAVDLSNVPDWLDEAGRRRLWDGLGRSVRPGGRVVLRSAFAAPPLPTGRAAALLVHDRALSGALTGEERTGIYRAVVVLRRSGDDAVADGPADDAGAVGVAGDAVALGPEQRR